MKMHPVDGLLFHILSHLRPDVAESIRRSGRVETAVIGLGSQGARHAGLMRDYGTEITAGVSKARDRVLGTVPVYGSVRECVLKHPEIAIASIWRATLTAPASALEAIVRWDGLRG